MDQYYKLQIKLIMPSNSNLKPVFVDVLVPSNLNFSKLHLLICASTNFLGNKEHDFYDVQSNTYISNKVILSDIKDFIDYNQETSKMISHQDNERDKITLIEEQNITLLDYFKKKNEIIYHYDRLNNWAFLVTLISSYEQKLVAGVVDTRGIFPCEDINYQTYLQLLKDYEAPLDSDISPSSSIIMAKIFKENLPFSTSIPFYKNNGITKVVYEEVQINRHDDNSLFFLDPSSLN